jgi:hypothetical protein
MFFRQLYFSFTKSRQTLPPYESEVNERRIQLIGRVAIWPFMKQFARNKIILPFCHFLVFLDLDKNSIFFGLFWQNFYKRYNIL